MTPYGDDFDEALETALALLQADQDPDDVWDANDHVNRALALRPDDADAWLIKCQVMSALGDDAAALACAEMALQHRPGSAEGHYFRATSLADLERPAEALAALEHAFRLIETDEDWLLESLYCEKAIVLDALDRNDEAVATFEAGLACCPESSVLKSGLEPLRRAQMRSEWKVLPGGRS